MSTLEVKELSHPTGEVLKIAAGKTLDLKSQGTTTLPTGSVLQVISAIKTDTFSVSVNNGYHDVTGLSLAITPSSTSSKILMQVNISVTSNERYAGVRLRRGSTDIAFGDADGIRQQVTVGVDSNQDETHNIHVMRNSSASYLDSPNTTSATTYKVQVGNIHSAGAIIYVNRVPSSDNGNYNIRGVSTITLMEIAG